VWKRENSKRKINLDFKETHRDFGEGNKVAKFSLSGLMGGFMSDNG